MLTPRDFRPIIESLSFRDWSFEWGHMGSGYYLQVAFLAPCNDTGVLAIHRGRKWYISSHAIPDEVVKTAWLAVEVALRHEAMETFTYKGRRVFNPHTDVDALIGLQDEGRIVTREEAAR
jgi:hypothetical protein